MARRKGVPRAEQHDWQPGAADMVQCSKCGHLASADQARRGIGPCPGKPDTDAPVPDSAEKLVPDGAQPVYQEEHLVGYIIPGSTSVTFLDGQPPVIAGGVPKEAESICDICAKSRPGCGNDPATVQAAVNNTILRCSDYRLGENAPPLTQPMPGHIIFQATADAAIGEDVMTTDPPDRGNWKEIGVAAKATGAGDIDRVLGIAAEPIRAGEVCRVNEETRQVFLYRGGDDPPGSQELPPIPRAVVTLATQEAQHPDANPEPVVHPGPNYIEPEEICNVCHGRLAIIPINTKMSMVACPNRGCDLWRERLRWYPRQDRNPRRRRASRANNGLSGS